VGVMNDSSTMEGRNRQTAEAQQATDLAIPTGSDVRSCRIPTITPGQQSHLPWILSD